MENPQLKEARVFHACLEDWENVQFGRMGDDVHPANVLTKCGGLKNLDPNRDDML